MKVITIHLRNRTIITGDDRFIVHSFEQFRRYFIDAYRAILIIKLSAAYFGVGLILVIAIIAMYYYLVIARYSLLIILGIDELISLL